MNSPFLNDMLSIVGQAFNNVYPGKTVEVYWNLSIPQPETGHVCGVTSFCEDQYGNEFAVIDIDPTLRVVDAVEVLAHEFAHVAAGEKVDHDDAWAAAYDAIHDEYDRITCRLFAETDVIKETIIVKSGKDYVPDDEERGEV